MTRWSSPTARSTSHVLSRFLSVFVLLLVLASAVLAADDTSLLPSAASDSFPQCGLSCSNLKQAQSGCVPPAAPANGHATYVSCFCQSNLLSNLHNSADGTCDDSCSSASDRSLLQKWYSNYCSSGGKTTTASSTKTTSAQKDSATSTSTAKAKAQNADPAPPSWWSSHYQWIIMVIVLIIGFAIITVLGVWLKRRHDAKYPSLYHAAGAGSTDSGLLFNRAPNATPSPAPGQPGPPPGAWAASQTPGQGPPAGYVNPDSVAGSSRTEVAVPQSRPSRTPSRLRKASQPADEGDVEIREVPR
ncbi:hypothetical protein P170DRAFT_278941 [Aspergillus steynii IBT 23096]|uniref:Integral membrane protein n=1 Tax=Aspergillus steynii IBT 23096 TaxID=1392250 RepID=A0A2I2FXF1_9EURO|nr:uncharacterized protein P170DRAFT_278941 [Aspergillus steynii IBT 23096]PLB45297.1 hypothetical protein P170DRAFT_278941 [Aspergillus steynii IBT 23096]